MISAREFCRERDFPYTIILTYSFDPIFFERIPLQDLQRGGGRRTLIIADGGELRTALSQSADQLSFLGRRYVLAETSASGIFHPKLIARLSPDGGKLWVGTGNVTYSGWGGNQELGVTWSVGPREDDKGGWLLPLLDAAGGAVRSSVYHEQLEDIRDRVGWLSQAVTAPNAMPVLIGTPERPLAPQIAERWRGRAFEEVKICTGSTDKNGAFLRWAHDTFGVRRAVICVNPAQASLIPAQLSKLPLQVEIVEPKDPQMMHAKFYWFSGPGGEAAIVGSANCSAAGWLSLGGIGNYETIVPYDAPRSEDFGHVLALFDEPGQSPETALRSHSSAAEEGREPAPPYELVGLRLRRNGAIEGLIEPSLPEVSSAILVIKIGRHSVDVPLKVRGSAFSGRVPTDFEAGPGAAFGHVVAKTGGSTISTPSRWIDNDAALARAGSEPLEVSGLNELRGVASNSDQDGILAAVYSVAQSLLKGRAGPGALAKLARKQKPAKAEEEGAPDEEDARPVDPASIIRGLGELRSNRTMGVGHSRSHGTSLVAVMALLFGREEEPEEEIDRSNAGWSGEDETEPSPPRERERASAPAGAGGQGKSPPINGEAARRFSEQIDHFLQGLVRSEFSQSCDAERLVQALAFPLLVCVKGLEGGWVSQSTLAAVGCRVVDAMLGKEHSTKAPGGLFGAVRQAYEASGRLEEFLEQVGDGTLWAALLASLCLPIGRQPRQYVLQAAALSRVYHCVDLVAHASPERLSGLLQSLIVPEAELSLTQKVQDVAAAMTQLLDTLRSEEANLYARQGGGRRYHPAGSLLWSAKWGWLVTPQKPAQSLVPGYVDVGAACQEHPAVKESMQRIENLLGPPDTPRSPT